jgi:hypothetical protein
VDPPIKQGTKDNPDVSAATKKARSRMVERQKVIEEYIASLLDFMKSILPKSN